MQCTRSGTAEVFNTHIDKTTTFLRDSGTEPLLQEAILHRIMQWRTNTALLNGRLPDDPSWTPDICDAIHSQDSIGWKNFLEGLPSTKWQLLQQRLYKSNNDKRTGRKWIQGLLRHLNNLTHAVWKHRSAAIHDKDHPLQQRSIRELHSEIFRELLWG